MKSIRVSRNFKITAKPSEGTKMFLQAYETKPCICCGRKEHAMLSKARTRSSFRGREYLCPIAEHRNLYPAPYNFLCVDYYPSPVKLAEDCNYDFEKATSRMRRLLIKGAGRHMTYTQWNSFWLEVRRSCEEDKPPESVVTNC